MDFSIIVPTWNREELVEKLLKSLYDERKRYDKGKSELLIIDSSKGDAKEKIISFCEKYDGKYISGSDSVRQKRNKGISLAKYDYILFIDSDVTVKLGLLDEYYKAYQDAKIDNLGGVLGYTEFVGDKSFYWKMLEKTSFVDSFSFARKYPYHSWTIGNNVSFKKDVLLEIGMFEENFPFKLGGDDLDLSYRVTKKGYMIGSAPNAVTYHSRETWNNFKAIHDRAKRWGSMEYFISKRHPEIYKKNILKSYLIETFVLLAMLILSLLLKNKIPVYIGLSWIIINLLINYLLDLRKNGYSSIFVYFGSKLIGAMYEFYRLKNFFIRGSFEALYKGLVFNFMQIKYGMENEAKRIKKLLYSFIVIFLLFIFYYVNCGFKG